MGVPLERHMLRDSIVCGSRPCIRSITKIAISQRDDPRDRRLLKDSWPGVSITNIPGMVKVTCSILFNRAVCCSKVFFSKKVAPICWVIPPATLLYVSMTEFYLTVWSYSYRHDP